MDQDLERALDRHRQGLLEEAISAYERILSRSPSDPAAGYYYSVALAARGRLPEALSAARVLSVARADDWRGHAQAGALLLAMGRAEEAVQSLRTAQTLEPARAEIQNNLGVALRSMGLASEAVEHFDRALALQPGYTDAAKNVCKTLAALGVNALEAGRTGEGVARLERCLAIDPLHADALAHLGNARLELGALNEARSMLLLAIENAPERAQFYRFLAEADPSALTDAHIEYLRSRAAGDLEPEERLEVHFALGKVYASRHEPQPAFAHLSAANAAARALRSYDEAETLQAFASIRDAFSVEFLNERAGNGYPSDLPAFIIGMPRSGTTLVEQLLSSHPLVHGAGELELFGDVTDAVLAAGTTLTPERMRDAPAHQLYEIGRRYAGSLRETAPSGARLVTDKMPANFRYAGLIHLALPGAKIIHVRRDPLDTCFSCFSQYFAGESLAWSYDLEELGRYYREYLGLMEHWRAVLPPGAMLEVQYEELVADFEAQARRIIEYCGLPWDDRCLSFHETKRAVRTASAAQVRKPLYRSSVGRSREYGALLRPLIDAFGATV